MAIIDAGQLDTYRLELGEALHRGDMVEARRIALELSPSRIASVLSEAPEDAILAFLRAVGWRRGAAVVGQLPEEMAVDLVPDLTDAECAELFAHLPTDAAAHIYRFLDEDQHERLKDLVSTKALSAMTTLAKYPPDSAGAAMNTDFIAIDHPITVGEVIDLIRSAPPEYERTFYVYMVNKDGTLRGVASLRDLVRYNPQQPVERAMTREVIAVHVNDPATEAAHHIRNRRFMMLPVLDENEVLVGIITFDDAMNILTKEVAGQFAKMGASSRDETFFTPPLGAVKKRLPWMAANVFLNLGAVAVIASFEATIEQVAILAAFLPMITDMGGNVGIQALSVSIRSIALGEVRISDFWHAMRKEIVIGLCNGLALGLLFGVIAYVIQANVFLGLVAGLALAMNVLVAGIVGGTIPFLIKRIGKDPAMMTGPILTTITDITGVSIYLGLSTLFLVHIL